MKILSIVETAFRATLEEQDDAALWCNGALQKAGMAIDFLIRGNAVNYAVVGQDPKGVRIGAATVEKPRILDQDLLALKNAGGQIRVVREDLEERGIALDSITKEFEVVGRDQIGDIVRGYDQVWHW
jgi:hypothetical protein